MLAPYLPAANSKLLEVAYLVAKSISSQRAMRPNERSRELRASREWSGMMPWHRLPSAARAALAFLLAWGALVAWRHEVLPLPPYYETAMGLFREADFLVDTHFDYERLRSREPPSNEGGAHSYVVSALPTLLALLMMVSPTPITTSVVAHLFSFAAAAVMVVALVWLVARRSNPWYGAAIAAAVITTPLVITQVELIGMDVPMAACVLLGVAAVVEARYALAALACLSAFFMKSTGLIASVAIILYLASAWSTSRLAKGNHCAVDSIRVGRHGLLLGAFWNILALLAGVGIYAWGGIHSRLMRVGFADDWIAHAWRVCPDLLVLAIVTVLLGFTTLGRRLWQARQAGVPWLAIARDWLFCDAALPLALLLVIGDLAAMRLYARVFVIRYVLLAVPFLYLLLATIVYRPRLGRWNLVLPVALVALNVYNADGRLFPDAGGHVRHCAPLERSREYLEDHRSQIAAMRALAAQDDAVPVLAGYPFSHYLSFPRLGYVEKPLSGYATMPIVVPTFRSVYQLLRDQPRRLVLISVDNPSHRVGSVYTPPPAPGDHVLYDDHQASPLVIYEKDLSQKAAQAGELENWYLVNLWGGGIERLPPAVWQVRAKELVAVGRSDLAIRLLERRGAAVPDDLASRIQLGQLYLRAGRGAEAAQIARNLLDAAQSRKVEAAFIGHGHLLLGLTLLQQRQLDAAHVEFEAALRIDPTLHDARVNLGVSDLLTGRLTEAERQFQIVLAERPDDAGANYHLGLIWSTQGRDADAERAFERAIKDNPKHFDALQQLAERRRKSRRPKEALEYYRRAIAERPDWLDGLNWSAWIMATSSEAALRNGRRALEFAERVCQESAYGNATALDTLAAAHAECGQFEQAVEFAQKALAVMPPDQQATLGEPIRQRLELYRRGLPYRES